MNVPFVDLRAQYASLKTEMDAAIAGILENTAFIGGRAVADFEAAFAAYHGVEHCVSVANGTEAIEIALRALGVGAGDEVIVPANTFIATAEAVTAVGAHVVFADCEPDYYGIDVQDVRRKITDRTRAIIPVHLYGHPADLDPIIELATENGLLVVEDCSQAHGARYKGRLVGTMGHAGTFSFYPGKNLGAYGDGGAILLKTTGYAQHARTIANHGSLVKYQHVLEGRNSRLDGIQAAVLSVKLPHLDDWCEARRRNARMYTQLLRDIDAVVAPKEAPWAEPVYHLYVVRVEGRDELLKRLNARGISAAIHYPISLPSLEAYRHLGHSFEDFPVANGQMSQLLSLPMYPELTEEMIRTVVVAIREEIAALEPITVG